MADTVKFIIETYKSKTYNEVIIDLKKLEDELFMKIRKNKNDCELIDFQKDISSILTYLGNGNIDDIERINKFISLIENIVAVNPYYAQLLKRLQ